MLVRADLIDAGEGASCTRWSATSSHADLGTERSLLHRRAARLLAADGALDGASPPTCCAAEPGADPWAAAVLAAAGRRALAEGAPDVAVRLLRRATPADAGILLLRGTAEFRTGADPLATLDESGRDRHA